MIGWCLYQATHLLCAIPSAWNIELPPRPLPGKLLFIPQEPIRGLSSEVYPAPFLAHVLAPAVCPVFPSSTCFIPAAIRMFITLTIAIL